MRPERDVDVLVVGSGAAGLAAALSARENGARSVLIAESEGQVGGSSRLSGGLMMGAGTRYQRALGIVDDAAARNAAVKPAAPVPSTTTSYTCSCIRSSRGL